MVTKLAKFSKEFIVESHDTNPFYELKLTSLLAYFQDTASNHLNSLGIDKSLINDNGLFWIVNRYYVDIKRMPKYYEKIRVVTYPGKDMKWIFPRYFEVIGEDNEVIIKASSTWLVLDYKQHKIALNPFDKDLLIHVDESIDIPLPGKLDYTCQELKEIRRVRYSDLDINMHFNNTKYIEFIVDTNRPEFYKNKSLKSFTINYLNEALADDEISLFTNFEENTEYIDGLCSDKPIFKAKLVFENR